MKKWVYSFLFLIFYLEAHAQSSWLDSAKNAASSTWESAQRALIYDDHPVQRFAEPLRQQIRQRVNEENQRLHGAHEAAIQTRQNGESCRAIGISRLLEESFDEKCEIDAITRSCLAAFGKAQSFDSNDTFLRSSAQERVTLQQLKAFHTGLIKQLNSIVAAREACYTHLSKPLVDGHAGECKQSIETTLIEHSEQVASFCTEDEFGIEINTFVDKMRTPEGPPQLVHIAKEQYIQVRKTEIQIARLLLSLTDTIQSRLTHERATASSEISQQKQIKNKDR